MAALLSAGTVLVNPAPALASAIPSPSNVTLTAGRRLIKVEWTAPSNPASPVTKYTATASTGEVCTVTGAPPATNCTITPVAANTPITVRVVACPTNLADCSAPTSPAGPVKAGPPATPPAPTANYLGGDQTSMRLNWTENDPGVGIASYRVTASPAFTTQTGSCTLLVVGTTCDVAGLTPATSYTFKLTAIGTTNGTGSTGSSAVGPASTPKYTGVPSTPEAPWRARVSNSSVSVGWTKPGGGATIAGYSVRATAGEVTSTACTAAADATECLATGLDPTKNYTFAVRANGEAGGGSSAFSEESEEIILGKPGQPDAPTVELGAKAGEVTVYWTAPEGGGTVTGYRVSADPEGDVAAPEDRDLGADVTRADYTGLANGVAYTFTVTALGAVDSDPSAPSGSIVSQLPGTPGTPEVMLGGEPGTVSLTWTAPDDGGPVIYYTVTAEPTPEDAAKGSQSGDCGFNLDNPSCTIEDLDPTASYTFTVTAIGDLGKTDSEPSAGVIPNRPGVPTHAVVALDGDGAKVTWDPPEEGTGGAVDEYVVSPMASEGVTPPQECTVAPDAEELSCTFPGLDASASYSFAVAATNASGPNGTPAEASVPDIPSAPQTVTATLGDEPGKVNLTWEAPETDIADRYEVVAHRATNEEPGDEEPVDGESVDEEPADDDGGSVAEPVESCTASGCDITELVPDSSYTFTVRAVNLLGGTTSEPSNALVPDAPGQPADVTVTVTEAGTVTVSWTAPTTGGAVDSYEVNGDQGGTCTPEPDATECEISALDLETAYKFTVTASNTAGDTPSDETDPVIPAAPGPPEEVVVGLGDEPGKVIINWAPPQGGAVTKYVVVPTPDDGGTLTPVCAEITPPTTSCTYTGLDTGTEYTFVVSAVNALAPEGTPADETEPIVPNKPGDPTDVEVALAMPPGSATVTWGPPEDDTGGYVETYEVTATPDGGSPVTGCTDMAADTPELKCDFSDLDKTKEYKFTVAAVNNSGSSAVDTDAVLPDKPGAPTDVTVSLSDTPGDLTVTWHEPSSGGAVDTYKVLVDVTGDGVDPTDCTVTMPDELSCDFADLTSDESYTFTVRATNLSGSTDSSTTGPIQPDKPNPPSPPTGEVTAADTIKLTWEAPELGGGPVATYTATAYDVDDPETPIGSADCTAVVELTCDFGDLDETRSYTFTVTANGPGGAKSDESEPSDELTTAPPAPPVAPTVTLAGAHAVRVTWPEPDSGGPVLAYSVTASPEIVVTGDCAMLDKRGCVFGGLISGTPYTFTVIAHGTADRDATGAASEPIVPGPPDTPAEPAVKATGNAGEVSVSWTAPDEGAGIAGYRVQSSPGRIGCAAPAGADATSCVVSGLDAATSYTFRVQAVGVTGSGDSAYSPSSESIVPKAPGRPYNLDVVAGDRQIAVSWTAPDLVQRVARYKATATPGGASCQTANNTVTECVITGLQNLTSYTVTVTAVGTGELGDAVSRPSSRVRPTAGVPGAPTGVQAVGGDTTALVSWTAPGNVGDGIAYYTVTASDGKGTRGCSTPDGGTTTCTITGLTNSQAYQVTVVSVGKAATGWSAPSAAVTVTPRTPPGTPKGVQATGGARSIVVQWTSGGDGDGLLNYTATATGGSTFSCTVTATTCTISSVTPGIYSVTVVANGTQQGIKSAASAPYEATALVAAAPSLPTAVPTTSNVVTLSTASAKAGGSVTISGSGYAAYTGIVLCLFGGPVRLGAAVTNGSGEFTATVQIPANTTTGSKTIVAGGLPTGSSTVRYAKAAFTVLSASPTLVAAAQRSAERVQLTR